jgi:hypothetical protein
MILLFYPEACFSDFSKNLFCFISQNFKNPLPRSIFLGTIPCQLCNKIEFFSSCSCIPLFLVHNYRRFGDIKGADEIFFFPCCELWSELSRTERQQSDTFILIIIIQEISEAYCHKEDQNYKDSFLATFIYVYLNNADDYLLLLGINIFCTYIY